MSDFCVLTGFENVVSTIELDQSLLACTDKNIKPQIRSDFIVLVDIIINSP